VPSSPKREDTTSTKKTLSEERASYALGEGGASLLVVENSVNRLFAGKGGWTGDDGRRPPVALWKGRKKGKHLLNQERGSSTTFR